MWEFNWSPDGRYLITGGFDAEIITTGGKHVAWLRGLRALVPSVALAVQAERVNVIAYGLAT